MRSPRKHDSYYLGGLLFGGASYDCCGAEQWCGKAREARSWFLWQDVCSWHAQNIFSSRATPSPHSRAPNPRTYLDRKPWSLCYALCFCRGSSHSKLQRALPARRHCTNAYTTHGWPCGTLLAASGGVCVWAKMLCTLGGCRVKSGQWAAEWKTPRRNASTGSVVREAAPEVVALCGAGALLPSGVSVGSASFLKKHY